MRQAVAPLHPADRSLFLERRAERRGAHGAQSSPAAAAQAEAAARGPSPWTAAVGRLGDRILRALRRDAERPAREVPVRAAAARPGWLRHRQGLSEGRGHDERHGEGRNKSPHHIHSLAIPFDKRTLVQYTRTL
jgi:hypothetical protein